jgi:SAM-dependent methyltransferase
LIYTKALLSKRYRDDGKPTLALSPSAREALDELREAIKTGEIVQKKRDRCPLCGFDKALLIAEKDRLGVSAKTVICANCSLVFNDSYFNDASARILYRQYWKRIQWDNDPVKNFQKRIRPDAYSWKRFAYICLNLKQRINSLKVVFEVGCGDECNLLPFHLSGREVYGCDFDEDCLNAGRKYKLNLFTGDISALKALNKKAELVILSHVFEHLIDLDDFLSRLKSLLVPDGYVYVEVPGLLNWVRPRKKALSEDGYASTNNFLAYLQSTHNFCFHLDSLKYFFEKNGFEIISGDEWVRAIFKLRSLKKSSASNKVKNRAFKSQISVLNHLKGVEADYLSIRNYPYRLAHRIIFRKKVGSLPFFIRNVKETFMTSRGD